MRPRLETPRLVIRQFVAGDWDAVSTILADPVSTRFMHFATWTEDQRRQWFDWCVANAQQPDADPIFWVITQRDTGDLLGWLGIESISDASVPGERSLGYLIDRHYWNQGFMTEALQAVLAYELGVGGSPRLVASCDVANPASARVMEKAGMRHEKTEFDAVSEGIPSQRHHYAITTAEFEARR